MTGMTNGAGQGGRRDCLGWIDGRFVAADSLAIPVGDAGFVLGTTVTEQLRTFGGRVFLPDDHARRMTRSLAVAGIDPGMPVARIFEAAAEVAARNHAAGDPDDDLGLCVLATPGDLPAQHGGRHGRPRVIVHAFPLAFMLWADAYSEGISLASVSVRQVPKDCWPLDLKCRSRMHYHLADREAAARHPGARALLCHADGRVSETSTANVVVVRDGRLASPPPGDALPGISLTFVRKLALDRGMAWEERTLSIDDCVFADELLLTSTPSCLLPVTMLDGRRIGNGRPGPVFRGLLAAWSGSVGVDIAAQAAGRVRAMRAATPDA
jgi:branched-subunit amino acid aminotransferase/4-amino-4-deoxychorismate lyase